MAEQDPNPMAWKDLPGLARRRLWCKICRDNGAPWILGENCSHVETAVWKGHLTREEAISTLNKFGRPMTQADWDQI